MEGGDKISSESFTALFYTIHWLYEAVNVIKNSCREKVCGTAITVASTLIMSKAGNWALVHFFGALAPKFLGVQVGALFSHFGCVK